MQNGNNEHGVHITTSKTAGDAANINYKQPSNEIEVAGSPSNDNGGGAWGPSLPKPFENVLPFEPDFTMFIGSPIGLFLSLRRAHPVFDSIRDVHPQRPTVSPFTLPTRAMYNIFSPSDPVAYRIEPLLLTQGTEELPDPMYLTRLGEGVRFHVKAKQLGDEIKKKMSWSLFSNVPKEKASSTGKTPASDVLENGSDEQPEKKNRVSKSAKDKASSDSGDKTLRFPLGGRSNRLDYVRILSHCLLAYSLSCHSMLLFHFSTG